MVVGKVTGSIFSTRKLDSLTGFKLMVVNIGKGKDDFVVAMDTLGAGIGDVVLVTLGDSARFACQNEKTPIDAVIVGIVDQSNYNL
ncbi:MAG: EutN/CcmL family microcompartment protein [Clostridia bacterium]|nr:ethanolamine utilization protein EutN [Oscillospiraceae bacterium]MBR5239535.1 EutN/CcmL family microcompartment protein [Clostridia bacterium]